MNKKLIILISSIVLLGLASCGQDSNTTSQVSVDTSAIAQEVSVEAEPVASASAYDDFSTAPFAYREFNGQELSNIGQQTVLFFAQSSCGTCQKTDADIKAQASLPDNVSILKVDFDTETELNEKYGVTTKHTFVLIDAEGNEVAKQIGLATAQDIASFVGENAQEEAEPVAATTSATTAAKAVGAAGLGAVTSKATEAKAAVTETANTVTEKVTEVKEVVTAKTEVAQKAVEQAVPEAPVAASGAGTYKNYSGTVPGNSVLFFHATWCPSCVNADKNFREEGNLSINADVIKVDFDNSDALKKKYGVTTKHTFVRVDANGNLVKKMTTGNNSSDLKALFN